MSGIEIAGLVGLVVAGFLVSCVLALIVGLDRGPHELAFFFGVVVTGVLCWRYYAHATKPDAPTPAAATVAVAEVEPPARPESRTNIWNAVEDKQVGTFLAGGLAVGCVLLFLGLAYNSHAEQGLFVLLLGFVLLQLSNQLYLFEPIFGPHSLSELVVAALSIFLCVVFGLAICDHPHAVFVLVLIGVVVTEITGVTHLGSLAWNYPTRSALGVLGFLVGMFFASLLEWRRLTKKFAVGAQHYVVEFLRDHSIYNSMVVPAELDAAFQQYVNGLYDNPFKKRSIKDHRGHIFSRSVYWPIRVPVYALVELIPEITARPLKALVRTFVDRGTSERLEALNPSLPPTSATAHKPRVSS